MRCPVCNSDTSHPLASPRRLFHRCESCLFVWADPSGRLDPGLAHLRYQQHHNSLENEGYVAYLNAILDRVFPEAGEVRTVLDWGSGPEAVCAALLRGRGLDVTIWDPYFARTPLAEGAVFDLVLSIEVAEHFQEPRGDFASLFSRVSGTGLAAVHTHLAPEQDGAFLSWWYTEDQTHVSFYSRKSLACIASKWAMSLLVLPGNRLCLFKPLSGRVS